MGSKPQRIARPLTRDEIEELAWNARADLGRSAAPGLINWLPIQEI